MIHKHFNLDGTPDLNRWVLQCDQCGYRTPLCGICPDCGRWHPINTLPDWLIPNEPHTGVYCPDCFVYEALMLIDTALCCPNCGSYNFQFWHDDLDDTHSAECRTCGTYTFGTDFPGSVDGWFTPPPEDR